MLSSFLLSIVVSCVIASPQFTKGGVKGGYYPSISTSGSNNQSLHSYDLRTNLTGNTYHEDLEVGVCYVEVPTASIVRDPSHIPSGNGSRPDLSRIRKCCTGYIRNIHNFKRCDPVCTVECVNALCTAPEVCTCHPDHVRNLGGFCVATCPIGCQNGHCSGGECMCDDGYKLDGSGRLCVPVCRAQCGNKGNCTSPNICECQAGYRSTPDGSCEPSCQPCDDGICVAPNKCECKPGYKLDSIGKCLPQCTDCSQAQCISPNVCNNNPTLLRGSYPIPNNQGNQYPQGNTNYPQQGTTYPPGNQFSQSGSQYPQNGNVYPQSGNQQKPGNTNSQSGHLYPVSGNQSPLSGDNSMYDNHSPRPGNNNNNEHGNSHPQQGNNYPQQGNSYPQQGNGYPQQGSNYPQQGSNYPQNGNNYPQQGNSYPQRGDAYPQQGNSYPQQGNSYPQRGDAYPQQGNSYPQQGNTYPVQGLYPQLPQNTYNQSDYEMISNSRGRGFEVLPLNQQSRQHCDSCVNGNCVGNVCQCNPGFVLDENDPTASRCLPNCPGGCPNGICSAPNFCICSIGYHKDHSVKGRALCIKK